MKEKISALMDGEVDDREMQQLIRELRSNPEQRDCWEKYHMIGDAMRNNLPSKLDRNFVNNISQAIAKEELPSSIISTPPATKSTAAKRHAVINPISGFAIAASVAAVAYLGVGMISIDEQLAGPSMASNTIQSAPATNLAQTLPQEGLQTVDVKEWNGAQPAAIDSRLKNYLYDHRNVAGFTAINPAVIPQSRLVVIYSGEGK